MDRQKTVDKIHRQMQGNSVLLYMKGTPYAPMCGFSAKVVQILNALNVRFSYVNVLDNPDIRATLPEVANWPTFPQLYIQGEFIGGCDIVTELHTAEELQPLLVKAQALGEHMQVSLASD